MIKGKTKLGEVLWRSLRNFFAIFVVKEFDRKVRQERKGNSGLLKSG
jgi:hypothetical protein